MIVRVQHQAGVLLDEEVPPRKDVEAKEAGGLCTEPPPPVHLGPWGAVVVLPAKGREGHGQGRGCVYIFFGGSQAAHSAGGLFGYVSLIVVGG